MRDYEKLELTDELLDDCLLDRLIAETPTDEEILASTGKSGKELIADYNRYHENLLALADRFELPLANKVETIMRLLALPPSADRIALLASFLARPEYLSELQAPRLTRFHEGRLAAYVAHRQRADWFESRWAQNKLLAKEYERIVPRLRRDGPHPETAPSLRDRLAGLYRAYIQNKAPLPANVEYMAGYALATEERAAAAPLLLFQIMVKYKNKLARDAIIVNSRALLQPKRYQAMESDNGKNFKTYSRYLLLFAELLELFADTSNVPLCKFGFERCSNLIDWLLRFNYESDRKAYHHSSRSLVEVSYGSVFYDESLLWEDEGLSFDEYRLLDDRDLCRRVPVDPAWTEPYLQRCREGREQAAAFVRELAAPFAAAIPYAAPFIEGELQYLADRQIKSQIAAKLDE